MTAIFSGATCDCSFKTPFAYFERQITKYASLIVRNNVRLSAQKRNLVYPNRYRRLCFKSNGIIFRNIVTLLQFTGARQATNPPVQNKTFEFVFLKSCGNRHLSQRKRTNGLARNDAKESFLILSLSIGSNSESWARTRISRLHSFRKILSKLMTWFWPPPWRAESALTSIFLCLLGTKQRAAQRQPALQG